MQVRICPRRRPIVSADISGPPRSAPQLRQTAKVLEGVTVASRRGTCGGLCIKLRLHQRTFVLQ